MEYSLRAFSKPGPSKSENRLSLRAMERAMKEQADSLPKPTPSLHVGFETPIPCSIPASRKGLSQNLGRRVARKGTPGPWLTAHMAVFPTDAEFIDRGRRPVLARVR